MYKKLTLDELCSINSRFFDNLQRLYKKNKFNYLKEFLKNIFKEWNCIYFFESNQAIFRIIKDINYRFIDETEKIELEVNDNDLSLLHNLLKSDKKITLLKKDNMTIFQILMQEFMEAKYEKINNKPYIVYDIETVWNINNLKTLKFMLAYSILSNDSHDKCMKFKLISEDNLKKFVDFLLEFDWYIVWYNNIYFDNPVIIYNVGYWQSEIENLNAKSFDLFLFLRNLTWKRMWLDYVSSSLVSIKKTLKSWLEWEELFKKYLSTWDKKLLQKVQNYCRNDVKMTLWVLLYLFKNKEIYIDWDKFVYSVEQMIDLSNQAKNWNAKIQNNTKKLIS